MNNACEGTEIAISSNVALLSDIHGNAPALQAVLEDIHHEHCTRVFMLGDLINGIDPHGCVHILRTWSEVKDVHLCCVKGNAEAYLTTPDRDALPRQNETRNKQLMRLIQWFHDHLEAGDVAWIQSFPDTMRWNDAYFVHDSPSDRVAVHTQHPDILPQYREWFYHGRGIHSKMADNEWRELLEYMDSEHLNYMFSGHTHRPFCHKIGTKVNSQSYKDNWKPLRKQIGLTIGDLFFFNEDSLIIELPTHKATAFLSKYHVDRDSEK